MPAPLLVLGAFFIVLGVQYIIACLKNGYWTGVSSLIVRTIVAKRVHILFAFIFLLLLIYFIDLRVSLFCKTHFEQNVYSILDFISSMAEGWFLGGVLVLLIMWHRLSGNKRLTALFSISLMALLYAGLVNTILKCVFNRERPGIILDPWRFFHFFAGGMHNYGELIYASNSMPSGHTIAVFATLVPIFMFATKIWQRLILVVMIALVCIARIYTLNHWCSDVYVAAILGWLIGYATYVANHRRLLVDI